MRHITAAMDEAWKSEDKTGPDNRPTARATIQIIKQRRYSYWDNNSPGEGFLGTKGSYTSIVMGDATAVTEIRNIKTITWTRSVNQDIAECTLTFKNTDLTPIGNQERFDQAGDFDLPGLMTYNRGDDQVYPNRWGYTDQTGWNSLFVPDRLVRTYEGYGANPLVVPGRDENMLLSGTWLVQQVSYTHDGDITLRMQDLASILTTQIVFPPVIPMQRYPLAWDKVHTQQEEGRDAQGGHWQTLTTAMGNATSSNMAYVGSGLTNLPYTSYVQSDGGVNGHTAQHVLSTNAKAYWLSTGQDKHMDTVWWQMNLNSPMPVAGLRIKTFSGPYRIFVSLWNGSRWLGQKMIPQWGDPTGGIDNGSEIRHIQTWSSEADPNATYDLILGRKYNNISKVRLTFYRLREGIGEHPFHAGLRDLGLYTGSYDSLHFGTGFRLRTEGNYSDYTDIVKWTCAWGGFYWPEHQTDRDFIKLGYGDQVELRRASPDPALAQNAGVWGDFMQSGTAGVATLTMDLFDKKPLMDMISYVRDILGFVFFIDETGGVVWRMPNLWSLGNYLSPSDLGVRTHGRTSSHVTIDEEETLISISTTLDSRNIRERIFVANSSGKFGATIKGFNPYDSDFRRYAGWTDEHFVTTRECLVMADLIAIQSMFSYRRSNIRIPGNPAIQIDDQIRVFERVTNDSFYHYVESISSTLSMETGEWFYDLGTHWLGERPEDAWAVTATSLHGVTQQYLAAIGS